MVLVVRVALVALVILRIRVLLVVLAVLAALVVLVVLVVLLVPVVLVVPIVLVALGTGTGTPINRANPKGGLDCDQPSGGSPLPLRVQAHSGEGTGWADRP